MIRLLAAAVVIQGISLMLLWRSLHRQVDELAAHARHSRELIWHHKNSREVGDT